MVIPQLKNTAATVAIIFVGIPLLNCYLMYGNGDLQSWDMLPHALAHSSFAAFWACVGWLLFRSPWAGKLTELLMTQKTTKGDEIKERTIKLTADDIAPPVEEKVKP